jgi:hypothetical protein
MDNDVVFTDRQNKIDDNAIFKNRPPKDKHPLLKGIFNISKKGLLSLIPHSKGKRFGYYTAELIPKDFKGKS